MTAELTCFCRTNFTTLRSIVTGVSHFKMCEALIFCHYWQSECLYLFLQDKALLTPNSHQATRHPFPFCSLFPHCYCYCKNCILLSCGCLYCVGSHRRDDFISCLLNTIWGFSLFTFIAHRGVVFRFTHTALNTLGSTEFGNMPLS